MMKMYAFELSNGDVAIHRDITERLPIAAQITRYEAGMPGITVDSHTEITDVPAERTFRNAWNLNGTDVEVDMPKARVIHMDRIRGRRDEVLIETDTELKIAEDANDGQGQAVARSKRRALRDLPVNTDLSGAATPAALDAIWPAELGPR